MQCINKIQVSFLAHITGWVGTQLGHAALVYAAIQGSIPLPSWGSIIP